jgi:hypothetical protein
MKEQVLAKVKNRQIGVVQNLLLWGVLSCSCGCSAFRNVEQWKCDHWGMCHFGTQRAAAAPALPPPVQGPDYCPEY